MAKYVDVSIALGFINAGAVRDVGAVLAIGGGIRIADIDDAIDVSNISKFGCVAPGVGDIVAASDFDAILVANVTVAHTVVAVSVAVPLVSCNASSHNAMLLASRNVFFMP
uniref:Uncharacterized protein n=1 Tax=Peronospora matthiolae TaxID=2874970 RepID=A0AAV1TS52_9STRA